MNGIFFVITEWYIL